MRHPTWFILAGLLAFVVLLPGVHPSVVFAGPAADTLSARINEVLAVLRTPAGSGDAAQRQTAEQIRLISQRMFDFQELSRRSLGRNWKKLAPAQQQEFVRLFRGVLEKAYLNKIMSYSDEKVVIGKETPLTANRKEVKTSILRKAGPIPIVYRMVDRQGTWLVYDVIIEGVSLVKNYRSQFKSILQRGSAESLLSLMRKKAAS